MAAVSLGGDNTLEAISASMQSLDTRFEKFEELMRTMKESFSKFSEELDQVRKDNENLKLENEYLNRRVSVLEDRLDSIERCDYNSIEIHGLPTINIDKKFDTAVEILKQTVGITVEANDLDQCSVINFKKQSVSGANMNGSCDSNGREKNESMMVIRFSSKRIRERILHDWRMARKSSSKPRFALLGNNNLNIWICERISKQRRLLLPRGC
ncbi:hypothetical protein DMENIID0001_044290 [Sergentomyia squamirostris]